MWNKLGLVFVVLPANIGRQDPIIQSTNILPYLGYGFLVIVLLILMMSSVKWRDLRTFKGLWTSDEIRKRIGSAILLVMIYRLAAAIPLTGINREAAEKAMEMTKNVHEGIGGFILSADVLAGGTLSTFSILSIGIYAYVLAQILINSLVLIIPSFARRAEEDPREFREVAGRWTSRVSLVLSIPLAFGLFNLYSGKFASCFSSLSNPPSFQVGASNLLGTVTIIFELIAAAKFAEWLTELLSEVFHRQGTAIIVTSGIAIELLRTFHRVVTNPQNSPLGIVIFVLVALASIVLVIYIQTGRRNIPIMYPQRSQVFSAMNRARITRSPGAVLPLPLGFARVDSVLHVQGLLTLPVFFTLPLLCTSNVKLQAFAARLHEFLNVSNLSYWIVFALVLIPYTLLYTNAYFSQQRYGDNLKRSGAQVPGLHPGHETERYLERIVNRLAVPFSLFLVFIALVPYLLNRIFNLGISPLFCVAIFIFVATARDIILSTEAELTLHGYQDGLLSR